MLNTKFESYKIAREIKRSGKEFEFFKQNVNEFGEPSGELISVGKLKGIYHEQNSYIQVKGTEASQIRTKKIPMILCLFEDVESLKVNGLGVGNIVQFNGKKFVLNGVVDVQEWNIICDVSLEAIDSGK